MKNDIDYELLEEKLKKTLIPSSRIFYRREKRGSNSSFKSVVIKNILTKDKETNKVKTFNADSIKYALYYIAKHGEGLTNERGESVTVNDVLKEWSDSLSKDPTHSEGMHLMFSIDELKTEKNFEALKKSVNDTMALFFSDYRYICEVHKHQAKPHIHVIINKHNIHTNKKITFKSMKDKKDFFRDMRENFKENLNRYNSNFNYRNYHRVEKDLVHLMLKDELKLMTTKDNFIKDIAKDVKKEIQILKDFNNQIETTRETNFKEFKFTSDPQVARHSINEFLKQDRKLEKQSQSAAKKINMKEVFAASLEELKKSDRLIDFQNHINYFESPAQKRAMGLIQYIKFDKIKKGFEQFKFDYDKEFKNKVFVEDKETIEFLSTRTSSWNINKQLKLIGNRKMEYAKLYNNVDPVVLQQLDKNYKDMLDLFKGRADHVPVLIKDYENQLKYENNSKQYKSIEKSIKTLKQELEFIDHMKSNLNLLDLNKQDHEKFVDKFFKKVDLVTKNTSAFKIDKLMIEAAHHTETREGLPDLLSEKVTNTIRKLETRLKYRKNQVFDNIEHLTKKILNEKDEDKREKLKEDLEFFNKEHKFIKEKYPHLSQKQSTKNKEKER